MNSLLELQNFSFTYPGQAEPALKDISLTVEQGDFLLLCGASGCGKTTLLRNLKPTLGLSGQQEGKILYCGAPLSDLDSRRAAEEIGFVVQSPEDGVVTDKVWHELAFGLESLGKPNAEIRRKTAEIAAFFGIEAWYDKPVSELSGGQKQILLLASVMVTEPKVLLLDEPTAQLDPVAAAELFAALSKVNRQLGTTVILSEHRLEEVFPLANQVAVLEKGRLLHCGTPAETALKLRDCKSNLFAAMPVPLRVWSALSGQGQAPLTVGAGRVFLEHYLSSRTLRPLPVEKPKECTSPVLAAKDVWFRYEKDAPDVLRDLNLEVFCGELLAVMGGNGAGKSTALHLLAGLAEPWRGELTAKGRVILLPQEPKTLFTKKTLRAELSDCGDAALASVAKTCRLLPLLERHPYDLSGGEQQRAALAKVLLQKPDILLLDEPTKGMDAAFKREFGALLRELTASGTAVVLVSHDAEFCAAYADRCAFFFGGNVVVTCPPREFFTGGSFCATAASRMAGGKIPGAIRAEDILYACGAEIPQEESAPEETESTEKMPPAPEKKALPAWRKVLAALGFIAAAISVWQILRVTDLKDLLQAESFLAPTAVQFKWCAIFLGGLLLAAFSLQGREKNAVILQSAHRPQLPAILILLAAVPLTVFCGVRFLDVRKYYFTALAVLLETLAAFYVSFERRRPQAREIALLAVLCAVGIAGRALFFMLPECKPVLAMTVIAGAALGAESGFLVGSVTMLASNVLFGQGPWTPWQMCTMGLCGFFAGLIFSRKGRSLSRLPLCAFGALASVLLYGGMMNFASALLWTQEFNLQIILTYYATGLPMDLVRACATWLFLWFLSEPMLEKLERVKLKYGI